MQIKKRKSRHKLIITATVLIVLIICGLGLFAFYQFLKINKENNVGQLVIKESTSDQSGNVASFCTADQNVTAVTGTFCSDELAIKLLVPAIFKDKLIKADNYPVFKGSLNPNTRMAAGTALEVYRGIVVSGTDTFTLTIAQEPLRTGYVDVYHAMQNTYFDAETKQLTRVNAPTQSSSSAGTKTTGVYSKGEPAPSYTAGTRRFFQGSNGDASARETTYLTVVDEKIIKVSLKQAGGTSTKASKAVKNAVSKELQQGLDSMTVK